MKPKITDKGSVMILSMGCCSAFDTADHELTFTIKTSVKKEALIGLDLMLEIETRFAQLVLNFHLILKHIITLQKILHIE